MTRTPGRYDGVTEREFQSQILELLQYNRWACYHTHDSRRSEAGYPDVTALHARTGDKFVAELKTEKGKATPAQLEWLARFEACGIDSYLWRPSAIDAIIQRVRKPR